MRLTIPALLLSGALALAGCASNGGESNVGGPQGALQQAGSSTVFPIAEAWAEEMAQRGIQVTVAGGGSGRGASSLCAGEVDIGDLSRPMKESEIAQCRANGIEPLQWKVAYDGITVVVSRDSDFVDHLTVEELREMWRQDSTVTTWRDVRPEWPAEPIRLYGPDSDSGTYEYFNEAVLGTDCGPEGDDICPPRSGYSPSPDDHVLVEGVAGSPHALGYFGFSYYVENQDRLRAVPVQGREAAQPVEPTFETIADGSYAPLSRPIFMVTDGQPEPGAPLHAYFEYAMNEGQELVPEVGYVALDEATLQEQRAWL